MQLPVTLNTLAMLHTLPSFEVLLLLYHIRLQIARCRVFILLKASLLRRFENLSPMPERSDFSFNDDFYSNRLLINDDAVYIALEPIAKWGSIMRHLKEGFIQSTVLLYQADYIVFKTCLLDFLWIGADCFLRMASVLIIRFCTTPLPY